MGYELFATPLFVSFAVCAVLVNIFIFFAKKKKIFDSRTSNRHIHMPGLSRMGGVAIILAFLLALYLNKKLVLSFPLLGVYVGSLSILLFGIWDDFKQLGWKTQLAFQILLVVVVYFLGLKLNFVSNPFGGLFIFSGLAGQIVGLMISVIWIVLLMNAMNWVDGADGVSGGVTLICATTIFFLSMRPEVNQPPVAIITSALAGSLLAFLIFNINPAKILAGTSGSMFMGFILSSLAIFAGAKIATTLLVLAVPIVDAFWVIIQRFRHKGSIFSPDKRHLHFRLIELGWSQRKICFFYWSITIFIAIIALNTRASGKIMAFIFVAVALLAMMSLIENKSKIVAKTK